MPRELAAEDEVVVQFTPEQARAREKAAAAYQEKAKAQRRPGDPSPTKLDYCKATRLLRRGNAYTVSGEYRLAVKFARARLGAEVQLPRRQLDCSRPRGSQRRRRATGSSRDGPRRESDDDEPLAPLPVRVPAGMLAALLRKRLENGWTYDELAREAELPPRRIRSIVNGEQAKVSFDVADAIVCRIFGADVWEVELSDLYGASA